jgi:hypothetical protein
MIINQSIIQDVKAIITQSRENAIRAVDHQRTLMYWHIGQRIFEEEQEGKDCIKYLNRRFQAQLKIGGQWLDVKEPNVYVVQQNAGKVINMVDDFYTFRKGGADDASTDEKLSNFILQRAKDKGTTLSTVVNLSIALGLGRAHKSLAGKYGVAPHRLGKLTQLLYGVSGDAVAAQPSIGAWFDVDSAFDVAIGSKYLFEKPELNFFADEINGWASNELPKLYSKHDILEPEASSGILNRYVSQFGEVPILDKNGFLHKQYAEKYKTQLRDLCLPTYLD